VLQVSSTEGVDCSRLRLTPVDNPLSSRVNQLVDAVRSQRPHLLQSVRVLAPDPDPDPDPNPNPSPIPKP